MSMTLKRADYIENRVAESEWNLLVAQQGWTDHTRVILFERFLTQNGLFPHFVRDLRDSGIVQPTEEV